MARSNFAYIAITRTVATAEVGLTFDRDELPDQSSEYITYKGDVLNQQFRSLTLTNESITDLAVNIDADPGDIDTINGTTDGMIGLPGNTTLVITNVLIKRIRMIYDVGGGTPVHIFLET